MAAWNNQPGLKAAGVAEMRANRAAGALVRRRDSPIQAGADGGFQGGFHVCLTVRRLAQERNVAIGELLADGGTAVRWLDQTERLWGIPQGVGALLDRCFERVPAGEAAEFAVAAVEAIPVGADLDQVATRWMLDLLADNEQGVLRHLENGAAADRVVELYRRKLAGESVPVSEWQAAAQGAHAASAQANAIQQAGVAATGFAAAFAAAAAYAPDMLPSEVRIAAWRAAVTLADEAAANAYQARYLESEALAQAAEYAVNTVEAVADAAFRAVLAPIREAAQRGRAAGPAASQADAAAAAQAQQAAAASRATCVEYQRWQARRLVQHLAQAPIGRGQ
ncbi:hypothetical protein [Actinocrispum sp. NPDC049592]|uniref:hypothetical protein n=1 Tax=Actinocrispum sp. NPDC049592 TaxID=3154835 RepID=UPI003449DFA9